LKNAQRVLFEGNVLEYTWPGFTQHGAAILLTALSQGGTTGNPNATVADITVRYNRISHASSGLVIAEPAYQWGPPKFEARLSVHDDIFDDLSPNYANGDSTMGAALAFQLTQCHACSPLQNILIDHVTMLMASPRITLIVGSTGAPSGPYIKGLTFTNNIVSSLPGLAVTAPGPAGPCAFYGSTDLARLNNCLAPYTFAKNALVGATSIWPSGNVYPSSALGIGFINYSSGSGGDYHLSQTSPYSKAATDGSDLGANVDAVDQVTAGVQ
jgi:hypothetical protein